MEMKLGNVLYKLMATAIVFSCLLVEINEAQEQQQCMRLRELRFCISYLNNTSQPPDSCCQPLDYIVKSLPECFCSLMTKLGVNRVESGRGDIDVSKAQTLPGRCGQGINPLDCIKGTSAARSNNPTPNYANSKIWDLSFVLTSLIVVLILNFRAL